MLLKIAHCSSVVDLHLIHFTPWWNWQLSFFVLQLIIRTASWLDEIPRLMETQVNCTENDFSCIHFILTQLAICTTPEGWGLYGHFSNCCFRHINIASLRGRRKSGLGIRLSSMSTCRVVVGKGITLPTSISLLWPHLVGGSKHEGSQLDQGCWVMYCLTSV